MDGLILQGVISIILMGVTYLFTRNKNKADVNKIIAETESVYSNRYKTELDSTLAFRDLLLSENNSLRKELKEVKEELAELKILIKSSLCKNAKTCKNRTE